MIGGINTQEWCLHTFSKTNLDLAIKIGSYAFLLKLNLSMYEKFLKLSQNDNHQ